MYSHHHSCGWKYCVLVYDAWKFAYTLKKVGIRYDGLDDYLIVECPALSDAEQFCLKLNGTPRTSIWHKGQMIYDSANTKESQDG